MLYPIDWAASEGAGKDRRGHLAKAGAPFSFGLYNPSSRVTSSPAGWMKPHAEYRKQNAGVRPHVAMVIEEGGGCRRGFDRGPGREYPYGLCPTINRVTSRPAGWMKELAKEPGEERKVTAARSPKSDREAGTAAGAIAKAGREYPFVSG